MKITDLQLEQYGIYHGASWQPSGTALNVVMGENESGKTTMLRFIRDMLFGYGRGKWQGRKGNMAFRRSDGQEYRVFCEEKERWFENSEHVKLEGELPALWWHGLNRSMYEKIFAVGLEDLQGASFLANDSVRSRFFMLQGGDKLSNARKEIQENKEKLFVASPQGKRKINQLMADLDAVNQELEDLSHQEKDFAELQKKQALLKTQVEELKKALSADQEKDKVLEKRLGAWEYYKRARAVKEQLDLSSQVKMFPSNGKEQWNQLMNRMKVIHEQKESLQEKLDEYKPQKKEEIIPWTGATEALEKLYVDLGQWRQTMADAALLEEERENWRLDFIQLGYSLPLWDRPLSLDTPCINVDWEEGRRLSKSLGVRNNELHFWEQREPEVEVLEEEATDGEALLTEEEWQALEGKANALENLLHQKADLEQKISALKSEEDKRYTPWFWLGLVLALGAIGGVAAFYMAMAGYTALYGSGGAAVVALISFLLHNQSIHKKGKDLEKWESSLSLLEERRKELAASFDGQAPSGTAELQAFQNRMQERRSDFYKNQAKRQAASWKRETVKKQEQQHQKWTEEGKLLQEKKAKAEKDWKEWLAGNQLPQTSPENLSALQEQWQKIYTAEGKGKILDLRLEQMDSKLDMYGKRANAIIAMTHMNYSVSPDGIQELYEETHKRSLAWQSILEKNNQHEAYEREMRKLDEGWASCQREMDTLLGLVNAKDAEEFAAKVNAHERHDQLVKEWENVRQDLRLYAGSEAAFDSLWQTLESGQYDQWMADHETLRKKIEEENGTLGDLQQQQGAVGNEIFRLADDDTITKTLQKKERIEGELKNALSEWLTYMYTEELLEKAQAAYESGKQPQIVKQANTFLQAMTKGKYSLTISNDGKEIGIIDGQHHVKDAKIWSSGTGDQVFLAIRLAMALSFGEQIEPLPMVLDDIFVRFDEERQRQTLRFLMDLGKTQQIFLFTCHAQTMRIAEEVGQEKGTGEFIHLHSGTIECGA